MTFSTGSNPIRRSSDPRRGGGFTLIELILVMAVLTIVFALALPALKSFFHGRDLDSEARRLLSLTRYGQSRAVSEGVQMVLWIDARRGAYGLQQQAGYADSDTRAVQFTLKEDMRVETQMPLVAVPSSQLNQSVPGVGNVPRIRFTPDGFIGETSPERIALRQGQDDAIWIVESTNRLRYEIQTSHSQVPRR